LIALYGAVTTSEGRWNQTRKMSLKEQLQQDLHQAIRDRDSQRKSALRLALARIANEEIAKQRELKDAETLDLIGTEIKLHRESLAEFEKAGRSDLAAEEKAQLEAVLVYLPPQMSRDEIVTAAQQAIAETNAKGPRELGQVMRVLMPRLNGRADGKVVSHVVGELLSGGE
jgi:uncharacterized protein YqeY